MTNSKFVIDVLSSNTNDIDERDKFALYRRLASLRQYVQIDPVDRVAKVFLLTGAGDGLFKVGSAHNVLMWDSIGFTLRMSLIFKGVKPGASPRSLEQSKLEIRSPSSLNRSIWQATPADSPLDRRGYR